MTTITSYSYTDQFLVINWQDGFISRLASIWLRDNCQLSCCKNIKNGQRLLNITNLPEEVVISHVQIDSNKLTITFAPEQHVSEFDINWLFNNCYCRNKSYDDRSEAVKTLWDRSTFASTIPTVNYSEYCLQPEIQREALQNVAKIGFTILNNVPIQPATVLQVISTFGYVRETNYGKLFDVQTEVNPNNLAFTNMGLGTHLDNPYRDPVPGLQLLHCLENSTLGGDSIIQDAFMAASILRQESHQNFDLLTKTDINFRFNDHSVDLHSLARTIELDSHDRITKVRFNNRSIAPLMIPESIMLEYYQAYRHFAAILERPTLQITFKLNPGQLLLFDNTRILHARKEFSSSGRRHLQGAYSDLDGLYSTLSTLN